MTAESSRLRCPRCGSERHGRVNSRRYKAKRLADLNIVALTHRCQDCGKDWVSIETPLLDKVAEAILAVLDD